MAQLREIFDLSSRMLLYLLAVVVVALVGGLLPALAAAVAAAALLAYYFLPPLHDFAIADPNNVVGLVGFLVVAGAVSSVVGLAARRAREAESLATANAESREELRRARPGRPARLDDYSQVSGAYGDAAAGWESGRWSRLRSSSRGVCGAQSARGGTGVCRPTPNSAWPASPSSSGTAIANADSRAQLTASRARIVAAADDARRRIERDLHDGTQQRLVALSLELRLAQSTVPAELLKLHRVQALGGSIEVNSPPGTVGHHRHVLSLSARDPPPRDICILPTSGVKHRVVCSRAGPGKAPHAR